MPSPTETATPVDIANLDLGQDPPELSETLGVASDITAAADAAQALGGDHAPVVAVALAGMAVVARRRSSSTGTGQSRSTSGR